MWMDLFVDPSEMLREREGREGVFDGCCSNSSHLDTHQHTSAIQKLQDQSLGRYEMDHWIIAFHLASIWTKTG